MISEMHAMLLSVFTLFKFRIDAPLIHSICVALALCIAVPRGSKNCFFNCAFLRYTVSLTVIIIIMNWFQSGQPALQYVASGVIGFVAVHCLLNGEVKQHEGATSQLMGRVWDWNMYGTKLKKFHGCFLHTANEDHKGEDDATAVPKDCGDGSRSGSDDHDGHHEDPGVASSEDSTDDETLTYGPRAVQILAIRANFHIRAINAYDWHEGRSIYRVREGEVQEEGMVDLVLTGPCRILEAYGGLGLIVFVADEEGSSTHPLKEKMGWDVAEDDEVAEYTQTVYASLGRKLEVTYLVMPDAIETHVEVKLNLKDLGLTSRAVYGTIKASAIDFGSRSVHLFCERGRSLSFPCSSTCILPLRPYIIALPYRRHFKLHIEVDLRVTTTCDNQEDDKNLKFSLDFTRRITSHEREVDGDQVEVNVTWYLDR